MYCREGTNVSSKTWFWSFYHIRFDFKREKKNIALAKKLLSLCRDPHFAIFFPNQVVCYIFELVFHFKKSVKQTLSESYK